LLAGRRAVICEFNIGKLVAAGLIILGGCEGHCKKNNDDERTAKLNGEYEEFIDISLLHSNSPSGLKSTQEFEAERQRPLSKNSSYFLYCVPHEAKRIDASHVFVPSSSPLRASTAIRFYIFIRINN
jgi:hypothetical protein